MEYVLYKTDGTREVLKRTEPMKYEELSKLVGGMIEYAQAYKGRVEHQNEEICVNEEGLVNNLPVNPFFTPLHQENYRGDIVQGYVDDKGEFLGFDEASPYFHEVKIIHPLMFVADKVFTIIQIGGFIANTTRGELKATGRSQLGNPIFKEVKKGARRTFTIRNLKDAETLIFEGLAKDLPFHIDGDEKIKVNDSFITSTIRGNALFNLHGEPEVIKDWVQHKNLNMFFTAYDKINHINEKGEETLLFLDRFASCENVARRQEKQLREKGQDISVGVGYAVGTIKK